MAIIHADGLFNGKRLRACSDRARLFWPYLFLAANGFGRLEIDCERLIREVFVDFRNPPKVSEILEMFKEYNENGLMFLYESGGRIWGQWDCKPGSLPRYQTSKDRESPSPDQNSFDEWKKSCLLKINTLPAISEIFGKFPRSVGVGVGVGVGEGVGEKHVASAKPPRKQRPVFVKPTIEEIEAYCKERGITNVDPKYFWFKNESAGWVVGRSGKPMQCWKSTVQTWALNNYGASSQPAKPSPTDELPLWTSADFRRQQEARAAIDAEWDRQNAGLFGEELPQ